MFTTAFWIDGPWRGRLGVSPRPRGGDWLADELAAWRSAGIEVVVSLLESEEAAEKGLEQESQLASDSGIEFHSLPIPDRFVPGSTLDFQLLLERLHSKLNDGKTIVVHCRQGIGRSGLVAICLLLRAGENLNEAVRRASSARSVSVPETEEQLAWLRANAEKIARGPQSKGDVLK